MGSATRAIAGLLLLAALAGCGESSGSSAAGTRRLTITGSSTVAPLAAEIAARFEKQHRGVRVDVQTGGSSRGVADVRSGLADIGMVSRELNPDESDLTGHVVARDGVCLIVHRDNPIEALDAEQVVAIYSGRIRNWKDVGGDNATITVVNKAEGRSTLELFSGHFEIDTRTIRADVVIGDNEQGVKMVAGNPAAIGYVSIGTAESDRASGVPIKLLPMGGIAASSASVADGSFPLARELNLVTAAAPGDLARQFIAFARSSEVRDLVEDLSFVPLP